MIVKLTDDLIVETTRVLYAETSGADVTVAMFFEGLTAVVTKTAVDTSLEEVLEKLRAGGRRAQVR